MNTKTMEGLVGASTNIKNTDVPMRVFRDARRRGDISVMERAMGYAADYAEKAHGYQAEAEEGMKEDAKEAREKAKAEQEKAIEKRREEREKMEERLEKSKEADTVEVSEEGKVLLKENMESGGVSLEEGKVENQTEPVIYTKDGTASTEVFAGKNVDVVVSE